MLRIGIIGAENSHTAAIGKLCNVEKIVDARVVALWGETPEFAKAAADAAQIPTIVSDWRELLGKVDGVMIDHRHAKYHAEPATFFVNHGIPCFVDKPFTFTLAEGKRLCALARRKKAPITSFSTLVLQKNFQEFRAEVEKIGPLAALTTTGPVDLKSVYGGVFFYGIHQVDPVIELLGPNPQWVEVKQQGANGVALIGYKDGPIVTMNCISAGCKQFHWMAVGQKELRAWPHKNDDAAYVAGLRLFVNMFATGKEPIDHKRFLAPIAVLEAMAKSYKLKQRVRVAKV